MSLWDCFSVYIMCMYQSSAHRSNSFLLNTYATASRVLSQGSNDSVMSEPILCVHTEITLYLALGAEPQL